MAILRAGVVKHVGMGDHVAEAVVVVVGRRPGARGDAHGKTGPLGVF